LFIIVGSGDIVGAKPPRISTGPYAICISF
jgi:hypothetical protein